MKAELFIDRISVNVEASAIKQKHKLPFKPSQNLEPMLEPRPKSGLCGVLVVKSNKHAQQTVTRHTDASRPGPASADRRARRERDGPGGSCII